MRKFSKFKPEKIAAVGTGEIINATKSALKLIEFEIQTITQP